MVQFILMSMKAVMPNIVGMILVGLAAVGITPNMTVEEAVMIATSLFFTSVLVWFTPNKKS